MRKHTRRATGGLIQENGKHCIIAASPRDPGAQNAREGERRIDERCLRLGLDLHRTEAPDLLQTAADLVESGPDVGEAVYWGKERRREGLHGITLDYG